MRCRDDAVGDRRKGAQRSAVRLSHLRHGRPPRDPPSNVVDAPQPRADRINDIADDVAVAFSELGPCHGRDFRAGRRCHDPGEGRVVHRAPDLLDEFYRKSMDSRRMHIMAPDNKAGFKSRRVER
jgi:hypothetical protein